MPKLNDILHASEEAFAAEQIPTPRLDAEVLLAHALHVDRSWLHAHDEAEISAKQAQIVQGFVERRIGREPVAYITGIKEFYGREFIVTTDVLIPRPETEDLVELALTDKAPLRKVIDVGSGSGCIGVTLKLERPGWDVTLVDSSKPALDVAARNAKKLGAAVSTMESNLLGSFSEESSYDIIVANLPYVDQSWKTSPETAHEPALALYAKDNGLALIFKLIQQSQVALCHSGYLLLEADPEQHQAIIHFASKNGFAHKKTRGYAISFMKLPLASQ